MVQSNAMPRVHDDFDCTNADRTYAGSSRPGDRVRGNGVESFEVRTLRGDVGSCTAVEMKVHSWQSAVGENVFPWERA
jgi:hypothetical protein